MPIDVMVGKPDSSEEADELEYVQGLRKRLEDAYDVAREHLERSAARKNELLDVQANEEPYKAQDLVWTKSRREG